MPSGARPGLLPTPPKSDISSPNQLLGYPIHPLKSQRLGGLPQVCRPPSDFGGSLGLPPPKAGNLFAISCPICYSDRQTVITCCKRYSLPAQMLQRRYRLFWQRAFEAQALSWRRTRNVHHIEAARDESGTHTETYAPLATHPLDAIRIHRANHSASILWRPACNSPDNSAHT